MSHRCPVKDCTVKVPDQQLMCGKHWRLVPKALGTRLYTAFRYKGKGTPEHEQAMALCVEAANRALEEG